MLGHKLRAFKTHTALSLEGLVPTQHFYRQVEAKLDLSFVRELVKHRYASQRGRPSVDPIVFFKLQLIMFFEGIRSERQLMEQVQVNLAFRWYIGYDLDEPIPDHSSLTRIRERYGLETFIAFFEAIVERCVQAGLVWGKELYLDGTKVQGNASVKSLVPTWYWQAKQHLATLFPEPIEEVSPPKEISSSIHARLIEKYNGQRLTGRRQVTYQRITDREVSLTDPDAAPMRGSSHAPSKLGYHTHYLVDGGKARIILMALVTPASIMDNTPMLDLVRWVRFRWKLKPKIAVGDTKYGTIVNIVGLERDGIRAYTPLPDHSQRNAFYPREMFHYQTDQDVYICPQGQALTLHKYSYSEDEKVYRCPAKICNVCPAKPQCTSSQSGRYLHRSFFQGYLDRVNAYHQTEAYKKALRKRQTWVEPLFGEGKQWHGMARLRLRGLKKANIEGLMIAAGQNIKRLLKVRLPHRYYLPPAVAMALPVPDNRPKAEAIIPHNSFFASLSLRFRLEVTCSVSSLYSLTC